MLCFKRPFVLSLSKDVARGAERLVLRQAQDERSFGRAIPLALAALLAMAVPGAAMAQDDAERPAASGVSLGLGKGTLVELPRAVSDVFVANNKIADVQVRSPTLVYVFGTGAGETSVYATDKGGKVVWSAAVRVGQNIDGLTSMLKLAMDDAPVTATSLNGMVLLTGDVGSAGEVAEAQRLTQAFVGDKVTVVNKLKTSAPVQVSLQVKIAEVSRDLIRQLGVNLLTRDLTGGFQFGVSRFGGSSGPTSTLNITGPAGNAATTFTSPGSGITALNLAGHLAGLDIASAIDLLERDNMVTVLAEPNLTAVSGETASFLAGGEFPIPVASALGQVTIEFKKYGVSLGFTPTVMGDGRISMRVRPEVSELTSTGGIVLNSISVPALLTRWVETTVELGSGQSFMIAGLMKNSAATGVDKAPFLGDLPILGALFKSDKFRRNETELVIVITPYLVKPMRTADVKLPTDGYQAPTDLQRWFLGRTFDGRNGSTRPAPKVASAQPAAAGVATPGFSQ